MASPIELHPVQRAGRQIRAVHRPVSLQAALSLLAADPSRSPIAGGTDLILDLARGGPGPDVELIDLTSITDLNSIHHLERETILGGGVTHAQVVADDRIRETDLPLAQACLEIGSPQLRSRATIAGNLITASPANDTISALMALGASVELTRLTDDHRSMETRQLRVEHLATGFRSTDRRADELITAIRVPHLTATQRGIWMKVGLRRAQAISVVHAGLVVDLDGEGRVVDARLALGSVAPTVILLEGFTDVLRGRRLDDQTIDRAIEHVLGAITPIDDIRASAAYRVDVTATIINRGLHAIRDNLHATNWPQGPPGLAIPGTSATVRPTPTITDRTAITVTVNGRARTNTGAASRTLLDWLRDLDPPGEQPLHGTKEGCAEGECGACTVIVDGAAVMSCLVAAAQLDGGKVTTIEGLTGDDTPADQSPHSLHPIQEAFVSEFAVQCGFCTPGFVMATERLLAEHRNPTREQIELGLSGNLCRCTGYTAIVDAVRRAVSAS